MLDIKTCNHTFNHVAQINKEGYVVPCCHYTFGYSPEWDKFNVANLDSLDKILTSDHWQNIRQEIKTGNNKSCSSCWNRERAGGHSKRMWANDKPVNSKYVIEDLEIALDTTCNMMCRICRPSQSSKWASATDVLEKLDKLLPHGSQYNQQGHNTNHRNDLMRVLNNTDLSHVTRIRIVGGEPFYSKNLLPLLERLDEQAGIENIELGFSTNGSIFPNNKILDILSRAKDLNIDLSIDGIGDLASVTRHGIEWNIINSNIQKFISYFGNSKIAIHSTISLLNVNRIQELYDYAYNLQLRSWTWTFLTGPEYLCVYQIPTAIRKKWQIKINKNWRGSSYNKELMSPIEAKEMFDLFLQATSILDTHQGQSFKSVNGKMYKLIKAMREENYA